MTYPRIKIPAKIVVDQKSDSHGVFVWGPLEPGLGYTLGNALRRALYAAPEGYAISHIRLPNGAVHEFQTLDGVVEDMTEIILNLKQVRLRKTSDVEEDRIHITLSGQKTFKAQDIASASSSFEVMNPDLVICRIEANVHFDIELVVAKGRRFSVADDHKPEKQIVGEVAIDATFTPLKNVAIRVENKLVDRSVDHEQLVLAITTDGTQSPEKVLKDAARVLRDHFIVLVDEKIEPMPTQTKEDQEVQGEALRIKKILDMSIDQAGLPQRVINVLRSNGINTIGHIASQLSAQKLMKMRNFGKKSIRALQDLLKEKGLAMGMDLSTFKP